MKLNSKKISQLNSNLRLEKFLSFGKEVKRKTKDGDLNLNIQIDLKKIKFSKFIK